MVGPASDALKYLLHPRQGCTVLISSEELKKVQGLSPLTVTPYVMDATNSSRHTLLNIMIGKLDAKERLLLASLGWRVTNTRRKTAS